jgi:DNA (cytosine-5)-methyltransferase 1
MSLGFQNAGFEIAIAIDSWNCAVECYSKNINHPVKAMDLSDVDKAAELVQQYKPDIIIGGPPCQDFSMAGNRQEGRRANLTLSFAQIVTRVSPTFFVMENVENISQSTTYSAALEIFRKAGYGITEKVLDASFCGVPQKRKRFFCIGEKNGNDGFLESALSFHQSIFPMTIREYFKQQEYVIDFEYYYRHPRSYTRRAIFSIDEASPTIRGVNRPKPLEYKRHAGDLVDPQGIRSLTFKERALIQTFPDAYLWDGILTDIEQMIGNAVPVKLAEYVARCLVKYIKGDIDVRNLGFIDWLKKEKKLSPRVAGNTLSRVGRARRILEIKSNDCDTYISELVTIENFLLIVPSVRSQIKRAVKLYFEYNSLSIVKYDDSNPF